MALNLYLFTRNVWKTTPTKLLVEGSIFGRVARIVPCSNHGCVHSCHEEKRKNTLINHKTIPSFRNFHSGAEAIGDFSLKSGGIKGSEGPTGFGGPDGSVSDQSTWIQHIMPQKPSKISATLSHCIVSPTIAYLFAIIDDFSW